MVQRRTSTQRRPGALGLLLVVVAGCGPGSSATGSKRPPEVGLSILDINHVGPTLPLVLSATGCDRVAALALYDHDQTLLAKPAPSGAQNTPLNLGYDQIPYPNGLAASLSLTVKATCDDGRENTSLPVSASYLPAEKVIASESGLPVVPDPFFARGSGASTVFIGCGQDSVGQTYLAKVGVDGRVLAKNASLPFPCGATAQFSDETAVGTRWMFDASYGALEFDLSLKVLAWRSGNVRALGVGPNGDAILWNDIPFSSWIQRLPHNGGAGTTPVWSHLPDGAVLAGPTVAPDGTIFVAYLRTAVPGSGSVTVERLEGASGNALALTSLKAVSWGLGDAEPRPPAGFALDGSVLYLEQDLANNHSGVLACSTAVGGCTASAPGSLKWQSPPLSGRVQALVPYAQGTRVAAVGGGAATFLNAATGAVVGSPVLPDGQLSISGVQPGTGADVYLLDGEPGRYAEVVALDRAESKPVFRYEMSRGTLSAAVADDGQLWLRIAENLVKPFPLTRYRQLAP